MGGARKLRDRRKAVLVGLTCAAAGVVAPLSALAQITPPSTPSTPSVPSVQVPSPPTIQPPSVNVPSPPSGGGVSVSPPSGNVSPPAGGGNVTVSPPGGDVTAGGGVAGGGNVSGTAPGAGTVTTGGGNVSVGGGGVQGTAPAVNAPGVQVTPGGGRIDTGSASGTAPTLNAGGNSISVGTGQLDPTSASGTGPSVSAGGNTIGIGSGSTPTGGGGGGVLGGGGVPVIGGGGVGVIGGGGGGGLPSVLPTGAAVATPAGGIVVPGSLGLTPRDGLLRDNPLFGGPGGSAGIIAPDSPNAFRPAALGAYRRNPLDASLTGRIGVDDGVPAGILGVDLAAAVAAAGQSPTVGGLLTPTGLAASQLPSNLVPHGGKDVLDQISSAVNSVIDHLPDWSRPIIGILLVLLLVAGTRALWMGHRARKLLKKLVAESADKEVLQGALVPHVPARLGGVNLSDDYRPAARLASGGDFYDAFELDANRVAIILGDVSGHDHAAITRANQLRHKLRTYLEKPFCFEPRMVLQAAGEALSTDSLEGDFATAVVAVHDTAAGTLTYACAGHPAPIIIGAAEHDPVSTCSSPALGWGLPTGHRQTTVVLGDGDIACFFTDGLVEARTSDGFLGREGLEQLIRELGAEGTAHELLSKVMQRTKEADDDLAALVLRAATPTARSGLRLEEFEISEADLQRKVPQRFLAACDASATLIERIHRTAPDLVAETGVALLQVRIDKDVAFVEATVVPLSERYAPARVLVS